MLGIEPRAVAAVQPLHPLAEIRVRRLNNGMIVVAHQSVSMDPEPVSLVHVCQQLQEMRPIPIVREDIPPLDAPPEDVIPAIRYRDPQRSCHVNTSSSSRVRRQLICLVSSPDPIRYVPGNHVGSACTFARHCGHLEAALYTLGIPFTEVAPAVWMKKLGALPKNKQARKRAIREEMQRRFPALGVTLGTADALGLLVTGVQ
jgi:hypothetical protein